MISIVEEILKKIDADYCEVHLEKRKTNNLILSNSHIEDVSKKDFFYGNIRLLNNNQWGFVSFNNLDDINKYIDVIKNNSNIKIKTLQKRGIAESKPIKKECKASVKIDPFSIDMEQKHHLLLSYDKILKNFTQLINRKFTYLERHEESYYGNSEGTLISQDKIFTGLSGIGVARDGNNIQIGRDSWGGYQGYEIVKDHDKEIEDIGKTAESLLKAEILEGGRYDVIIDPKLSGVFAHEAFGHLSEADFIFENPEMRKIMEIGRCFGEEQLNIIDNGSIPEQAGFIFADDEGILPQKTFLIKNGVLASRLHSRETAHKMNEPLTGNARSINAFFQPIVRMTNTYIDKGEYSFDEMLASVEDGVYAVDCVGGQTNLEMFTFSAGCAYEIKKGQIKRLLKNIVLTGNVFETLKNINMIGNDLKLFGGLGGCGKSGQSPLPVSTGGPHIKIKNVLIGGQ